MTFDRWLYTQYRRNLRNTRPQYWKDRPIHRIERAVLIWPLHLYAWWRTRNTTTTTAPTGAIFIPENKEDA